MEASIPTAVKMTKPRILLVEDDPVSRHYLSAAVEALPAAVTVAGDCGAALQQANAQPFDLWLIDANLPDGHGADLLARLRGVSASTPAVAHTASTQGLAHDALRAAGFLDVLVKPIAAQALQAQLRSILDIDATQSGNDTRISDWDDAIALAAVNGQQSHVVALRQLFLAELPVQRQAIVSAFERDDSQGAAQTLHLLRASCGFVGAGRLHAAVRLLEGQPRSPSARAGFLEAVDALLSGPG